MAVETNQVLRTLGNVFTYVAAFAGGSVPLETDEEYAQWLLWVQNKQEEYAVRGFWRRLLTREEIVIEGDTTVLPKRFHKPNGLYILDVNGKDYADPDNPKLTVEMINDPNDTNYGKWQMRFVETQDTQNAILWYFANPPKPTEPNDYILLPGDLISYAVLGEYYRTTGAEGSQDKSEQDAENRFQEYMSLEVIPARHELLKFNRPRVDRIANLKRMYYRNNRGYQG
jgi:hypothetical protein